MKNKVIVFGDGGHARAVVDVLFSSKDLEPVAVVGIDESNSTFWKEHGIRWIHESDAEKVSAIGNFGIVGIGQIRDPEPRNRAFTRLLSLGLSPATAISPFAYVSRTAQIGSGTAIFHGAILNSNSSVGQNSIINSNALLEHDVFVGDGSHVSTSATINGGTKCGSNTFIGSGAILKQELSIGSNCFVAMGSIVTKSMVDCEIWNDNKEARA